LAVEYTHSFDWMWWADAGLALMAALASFAIVPQGQQKPQTDTSQPIIS